MQFPLRLVPSRLAVVDFRLRHCDEVPRLATHDGIPARHTLNIPLVPSEAGCYPQLDWPGGLQRADSERLDPRITSRCAGVADGHGEEGSRSFVRQGKDGWKGS